MGDFHCLHCDKELNLDDCLYIGQTHGSHDSMMVCVGKAHVILDNPLVFCDGACFGAFLSAKKGWR